MKVPGLGIVRKMAGTKMVGSKMDGLMMVGAKTVGHKTDGPRMGLTERRGMVVPKQAGTVRARVLGANPRA